MRTRMTSIPRDIRSLLAKLLGALKKRAGYVMSLRRWKQYYAEFLASNPPDDHDAWWAAHDEWSQRCEAREVWRTRNRGWKDAGTVADYFRHMSERASQVRALEEDEVD